MSVKGLEFWAGGEVRSANVGPAVGQKLLGRIDEPGVYFFLGPNTSGKSHLWNLLSLLQKERLLRSDADISDGESSAYLEFALARVTFRRLGSGEVLEPVREGVESLPRIEAMPAPIEALITGNHLKGEEPRARARLEALLTYAPVLSTPELVHALCGGLGARPTLSTDPGPERRALWERLAAEAKEKNRKLRVEPFRTAAEVVAWLLAQPREGILDDHERLADLLNATANTAEKLVEIQGQRVAAAGGGVKEAVAAAAYQLQHEDSPALVALLRARVGEVLDPKVASDLRVRAATLKAQAQARRQEEERREALRAQHGARPDPAVARALYNEADEAHQRALADAQRAVIDYAKAERSRGDAGPRVAVARTRVLQAWANWFDEASCLDDFFWTPGEEPSTGAEAMSLSDRFKIPDGILAVRDRALEASRRAGELVSVLDQVQQDLSAEGALAAAAEAALAAHQAAEAALASARQTVLAREAELDAVRSQVEAWEATAALLAEAVTGPSDEEVAAAEQLVREAEREEVLLASADRYRRASAVQEAEEEVLSWFQGVASDLRKAVQESWKYLGSVVTEQLAVPWLQVAGLRILVAYNHAGANARLAATPEEAVDIRDLDDADRVSEAELHEAVLKLMLSRREKLGGILLLPGKTLYPLDEGKLAAFSGWARDAGLWVISEKPRRKGDPEDLVLQYVTPAPESAP